MTYLPIASNRVIKYALQCCDQPGRSGKDDTTAQRSFTTTHNSSHHLQSSEAQHQPSESKASSLDRQQTGATQQTCTYIACGAVHAVIEARAKMLSRLGNDCVINGFSKCLPIGAGHSSEVKGNHLLGAQACCSVVAKPRAGC